ncbi:MAG: tetratricopeptide repeat protein [Desulfobacteraceae bacterium]|nr:tetratricopeptide repeat protein [Desulfobacteraceae bacterium]
MGIKRFVLKACGTVTPLFMCALICSGCIGSVKNNNNQLRQLESEEPVTARPPIWDTEKLKPNHLALAEDLMEKGFHDVALVQLNLAMEQNGKSSKIYNLRGVCHRENENFTKAEADFKKAVSMDEKNASAFNNLGILFSMTQKNDPALACLKQAVALDPARTEFFNNLGVQQMNMEKYAHAEESFNKSLALEPGDENAVNNLAICLGLEKKDDRAMELLLRHHAPDSAFYNMGCIYEMRNEHEKAEKMFNLASERKKIRERVVEKPFAAQVLNPRAPLDPTPPDGLTGELADAIYTQKYEKKMKTSSGGGGKKKK